MRVFISGYGFVSAFGKSWTEFREGLKKGKNAVKFMEEWQRLAPELTSFLAAPVPNYAPPKEWSRKQLRSLGRVSCYAVEAAGDALKMAGLFDDPCIKDGRMGVASGQSIGSTGDTFKIAKFVSGGENTCDANTYMRMMPHTTAANVAIFYGLKGRLIPTSSACVSSSLAIGYSYEAIKNGKAEMMLAGGGEELCVSETFVFNMLYATSQRNSEPHLTPRPFDAAHDGLVIGEGAAFVVVESEESVKRRGVRPICEIVGFGTTCDGTHMTNPQSETMARACTLALKDAALDAGEVGFVSAHATATKAGDIAESIATNSVFGSRVPIASLKSYVGHTLGACGSLESIAAFEMMRDELFFPTLNLTSPDPECAELDYLKEPRHISTEFVMNNNFAFGGINTSLIFKRV